MEYDLVQLAILPFIGAGLSLASLIGSAVSGGGGGDSTEEGEALRKKLLSRIGTQEGTAFGGPSQARRDFDPVGQASEATQSSFRLMAPDFFRGIEDLTGGAVGAGRLKTGFFTEDLGDFTRRGLQQFADTASANSLQALGLDLRNIEGGERTELGNRGLFFDTLLEGLDTEQARKNAQDRSKSSLFGTLGSVGGSLLGLGGFNPFGKATKSRGGARSDRNTRGFG